MVIHPLGLEPIEDESVGRKHLRSGERQKDICDEPVMCKKQYKAYQHSWITHSKQ